VQSDDAFLRHLGSPFDREGRSRHLADWLQAAAIEFTAAIDRDEQRRAFRPLRIAAPDSPLPELAAHVEVVASDGLVALIKELIEGISTLLAAGRERGLVRVFIWKVIATILYEFDHEPRDVERATNHLATAYMRNKPNTYDTYEVAAVADAVAALPHSEAQLALLEQLTLWDPRSARRSAAQLVLAVISMAPDQYQLVLSNYTDWVRSVMIPADALTEEFVSCFESLTLEHLGNTATSKQPTADLINALTHKAPERMAIHHLQARDEEVRLIFDHLEGLDSLREPAM
jgi:hypothetical protein